MLRTVYLKSLRDRLLGVSIGVVALFLTAWMGLWAYSGVDDADAYISSMPDAYADLLGITRESGTAGLMMSMMFGFMGAFVLGGLAISMGASAIAGEEQDGTMDVLATAPRSRARLHASKAAAYLTLLIGGSFVATASYWLAAKLVGADISTLDHTAATVHLTTVLLVYGILAFAVGAATGNRATASGIATGLLIISFLGAGLLPLIDGWEDVGKIFPWHYISGASPLVNGTNWAQIGVLSAVWVVMLVLGGLAFTRRDLRSGGLASSLADRLRANPRMAEYTERYFLRAVATGEPVWEIEPATEWTEEFLDWSTQADSARPRAMRPSPGWGWLRGGVAEGPLLGGCLESLQHLRGTDSWPNWDGAIFFFETSDFSPLRENNSGNGLSTTI